eukprot:s9601_g1.t1
MHLWEFGGGTRAARGEAHANLELQNHYQQTALLCASIAGHVEVVGALLQAGAGKNRKDCDGDTALGAAHS